MQVQETKSEGLSRELTVTIPAKDIDARIEGRLLQVGRDIRLPGFRPGKVPMPILKKRYGRAVMGEVLEQAVNETSGKVVSEKGLRPAMQPKIEVKEFDEGKDLTFTMEVEILPNFDLVEIKDIKLEKPVAAVDQDAVDEALSRIASQSKDSKKIESDRKSKKGDILLMDFHGRTKDDGVEHEGMHAHGHKLELGSGQFIPGFEDQLTGKKAGEKVAVEVSFPESYGAKELAGRDAIFDVEIHEIHESVEAEINDDFAKKLGFDSEEALRKAVEGQILAEYEQMSRMKLKRQLLDYLDANHELDVPEKMVEMEYNGIETQIKQERAADPNAETQEIDEDEKEELQAIALRRVRLGLILSEIGNKNGVTVGQQELQQAVIKEAQRYPGQEKQVFDFYQKNPQALEGMKAPLFEDKVVDFIVEKAKVTEKKVSLEELTAEDEETAVQKSDKAKKGAAKKKAPAKKIESKKTETKKPAAKKAEDKSADKKEPKKKTPAKSAPKAKKAAAK